MTEQEQNNGITATLIEVSAQAGLTRPHETNISARNTSDRFAFLGGGGGGGGLPFGGGGVPSGRGESVFWGSDLLGRGSASR